MSKIKNIFSKKLARELVLAVTVSLLIAYLAYEPLSGFGYYLLDKTLMSPSYVKRTEEDFVQKLQSFIDENEITSKEISQIHKWMKEQGNTSISFYYKDYEIFNSDFGAVPPEGDSLENYFNQYIKNNFAEPVQEQGDIPMYQITFSDHITLDTQVFCYFYVKYYVVLYYACLFLCFLIFLLLFLFFIHRKIQYINKLAEDLEILEGGDLNYKVRENGCDELYRLAVGINQMRKSIIERDENEQAVKEAHQKLITAMSHDLRTPLTSLIGYVELLILGRYQNQDQLHNFLGHIKNKAYKIKQLSDKLFEYFLVSERGEEAYQKELIPTINLITGLSDDQLFTLESEGFEIESQFDLDSLKSNCYLDIEYVQRTLDNILSNIHKYADASYPLHVISREKDGYFVLEFHNRIEEDLSAHESTGIGIKTCERIMHIHGGYFECYKDGIWFISRIKMPVISKSTLSE
ncbi:histidine kinase dimerization/phospho-acceptor domain-containing protein [Robinsoniella peoriensis]|uniref:HAMP domain-containing sensor histidine kinase n=1 Tax=Robinsoniella peoriensis TaxID=180332 RepID=UPI0037532930